MVMRAVCRTILLLLLSRCLHGCQPYIDQVDESADFQGRFIDFGVRRELKLIDFKGDRESLLLVFNQPLEEPASNNRASPFIPTFYPRVTVREVKREGAAGVRVRFQDKLPPARSYTATVPNGWRAVTGATFLSPTRVEWETERPALLEVDTASGLDGWVPGEPLRLVFNQAVDRQSVLDSMELTDGSSRPVTLATPPALHADEGNPSVYLLDLGGLQPNKRFLLSLREGVKPEQGRLTGLASKLFEFGPREKPRQTRPKEQRLEGDAPPDPTFDDPVERTVLDCVTVPPGTTTLSLRAQALVEVDTWSLSERQLVELLLRRKNDDAVVTRLEAAKPSYSGRQEKAVERVRWLPASYNQTAKTEYGAFWVRMRCDRTRIEHRLIVRSDMAVSALAINQTTAVKTTEKNAAATLYSARGERLAESGTSIDGEVSFSSAYRATPVLALIRKGKQMQAAAVLRQALPASKVPSGVLWSDRTVCEPGRSLEFFGVWWGGGELPEIALRESSGKKLDRKVDIETMGRLFRGSVMVPQSSGKYILSFGSGASNRSALSFEVAHFAGGEYPSDLTLQRDDSGRFSGKYFWRGPGAEFLGVRASLFPDPEQTGGWSSPGEDSPPQSPIEVEVEQTLEGAEFRLAELPKQAGLSSLRVELYDTRETSRVYRRVSRVMGERKIRLTKAVSRLGKGDGTSLFFEFSPTEELSEGEVLECELLVLKDGGWRSVARSAAVESGDGYAWTTSVASGDRARLNVYRAGLNSISALGTWEKVLPSLRGDWAPLSLAVERVKPGDKVSVSWPGPERNKTAWVGIMIGEQAPTLYPRRLDSDGNLGTVSIPPLSPGVEAVTVFAVVETDKRKTLYRKAELTVEEKSVVAPINVRINESDDFQSCKRGDKLIFDFPDSTGERALIWWQNETDRQSSITASPWKEFLNREQDSRLVVQPPDGHWTRGPLHLTEQRVDITAPSRPGRYTLRVLADSEKSLRYFQREVEVLESTHWSETVPRFVRPGDVFYAGIRFWTDPKGPVTLGVTASADLSASLRPLSYYTTSSLTKPGSSADLVFGYQAPESFAAHRREGFTLRWKLGLQGAREAVEAEIPVFPSPARSELYRSRKLSAHSALKLSLAEEDIWRVDLRVEPPPEALEEGSKLGVKLGSDSLRTLELGGEHPNARLFKTGSGEIEIHHLEGAPVQVDIYLLRSEQTSRRANRLYLLNYLEDFQGKPLNRDQAIKIGQKFRAAYSLVVPEKLPACRLEVPLPGGVKVEGCRLLRENEPKPIGWSMKEDRLRVDIPALEAGEHRVAVILEPVARGDYYWPTPTLEASDGFLNASGEPRRLSISE